MVFSSITFLFLFLPALVIIYYAAPSKLKNLVLILASLMFYAWGEVRYIVIMLFLSFIDYTCGKQINKHIENVRKKKLFMFISIILNLSSLIFFKYSDFFITNINNCLGVNIPLLNMYLPLGISFITFQSISYIIDVYRGTTTCEKSYYNYLTYVTFFPKVIQGPIIRYGTMKEDLSNPKINTDNFSKGLRRFILGLGKKVLIANNVAQLWNIIQSGNITEMSLLLYWMGGIAFTLQIYFDFSGYSDMAIGLAEIFGFTFAENFNYPYVANSITDFWRRWHISLSTWFRDYIYIPLGGNRRGKFIHLRNLLIVWILTGFWHGASWNFILWGFYFAILLILEKFVLSKPLNKLFKPLQHAYTLILIVISWVIFYFEDFSKLKHYLQGMFGLTGDVLINNKSLYYLLNYAIVFALAALLSTPFLKNKLSKLENSKNKVTLILTSLFYVFIFIASVAYLVNSTYNTFLYFKF